MPDAVDDHATPRSEGVEAPPLVLSLVQRFTEHLDVYRSGACNETELRRDFLDPFFGLDGLGWDVANVLGADERYRPVVHEDRIKVGGSTKAPDYPICIGGVREQIRRRIEATDREIDQLVYRLYDLTSDEIGIVEAER